MASAIKKELGFEYRLGSDLSIEYSLSTFKIEMKDAEIKIISYSFQLGEIRVKIES